MGLRIEREDSGKERGKDEGEGAENREGGLWEREIEREESGRERSSWWTREGSGVFEKDVMCVRFECVCVCVIRFGPGARDFGKLDPARPFVYLDPPRFVHKILWTRPVPAPNRQYSPLPAGPRPICPPLNLYMF